MFIFVQMQLVSRSNIDIVKWNHLVENTPGAAFFSYSWYLDEIAENWCVFVDDVYSKGIAIPFTVRLGVKMAYTPIFVSYVEWLGDSKYDQTELLNVLRKEFKGFDLAFKTQLLNIPSEDFSSQYIFPNDDSKLGSQAKRMLNKATKAGYKTNVTDQFEKVFGLIESELKGKFTGMTDESLSRLESAIVSARRVGVLKVFEVISDEKVVGGVICLEKEDQLYYLKGAADSISKKNGAMYFAINASIEYAKWKKILFDFGGSRVEGVRKFNENLGGQNNDYFFYSEDNSPLWFRLLKRLKKLTSKN